MVVNFTIEGDVQGTILIAHRLMSGRDIHNTQPSMAQPNTAIYKRAFIVRPTVSNHIAHSLEHATINMAP
jgi:hypothetical protein